MKSNQSFPPLKMTPFISALMPWVSPNIFSSEIFATTVSWFLSFCVNFPVPIIFFNPHSWTSFISGKFSSTFILKYIQNSLHILQISVDYIGFILLDNHHLLSNLLITFSTGFHLIFSHLINPTPPYSLLDAHLLNVVLPIWPLLRLSASEFLVIEVVASCFLSSF